MEFDELRRRGVHVERVQLLPETESEMGRDRRKMHPAGVVHGGVQDDGYAVSDGVHESREVQGRHRKVEQRAVLRPAVVIAEEMRQHLRWTRWTSCTRAAVVQMGSTMRAQWVVLRFAAVVSARMLQMQGPADVEPGQERLLALNGLLTGA